MGRVTTTRVYAPAERSDGVRFLVDRVWPRGIAKQALQMTAWLKEVEPSARLRKCFGHDAARRDEVRKRNVAERDANPDAWRPVPDALQGGDVTPHARLR